MDEIISTNLHNNSNAQHFQVMNSSNSAFQKEDATLLKLEAEFAEFNVLVQAYSDNFKSLGVKQESHDIKMLDDERDNLLRGFFSSAKSYTQGPTLEVRRSGERVYEVLEKYGRDMLKESYEAETGLIENLLLDLRSEELSEDLLRIHANEWIVPIEEANNKFSEVYYNRRDELMVKEKGITRKCRDACQTAFENICKRINAYSLAFGLDLYQTLINVVNQEVSAAQELAKRKYGDSDN